MNINIALQYNHIFESTHHSLTSQGTVESVISFVRDGGGREKVPAKVDCPNECPKSAEIWDFSILGAAKLNNLVSSAATSVVQVALTRVMSLVVAAALELEFFRMALCAVVDCSNHSEPGPIPGMKSTIRSPSSSITM